MIVYKGQLNPEQLPAYFSDLRDPRLVSHVALVHGRFSTNTFPSWARAQPMRFLCHNGEINTLQGNVNWMRARQGLLESDLYGEDFDKLFPVLDPETSDSGILDNALELLASAGRSLPEAVMMLIPEAWENHESMSPDRRAMYQYNASLMEPWDGPAAITAYGGDWIIAGMDRNGFRPMRYSLTKDNMLFLGSETGMVDIKSHKIIKKGHIPPGQILGVNFK